MQYHVHIVLPQLYVEFEGHSFIICRCQGGLQLGEGRKTFSKDKWGYETS